MTNEGKQEALRALDDLANVMNLRKLYPAAYETIRAALTEAPKVDVEGLKLSALQDFVGQGHTKSKEQWEFCCRFIDHLTTHYDLVKKSEG